MQQTPSKVNYPLHSKPARANSSGGSAVRDRPGDKRTARCNPGSGYVTQTNPAASELLAAVPTVGANLRGVDADGLEHAGQTLVAQGIEAELLADALKHALAALG